MKQEHRAIEKLIKGLNTARVIEKETFSIKMPEKFSIP